MYFFMFTKWYKEKTKMPVSDRYQTEINFRKFVIFFLNAHNIVLP